ncbi:4098314e-0b9c-44a1-9bef-a1d880fc0ac4-CDS [Sclerotinia trifoliorum]|uniref:4098314e-0b9c-44a1-9bef-a1d880fc0ac4-CDS n=1 Tax=Sclerotinia trifoliorum TaxID=28548 RepID=A0A8H2ZSK5_9HELO|nr:4098314e-0b9c-44a1-9bef-a1d880fc0ac4-CDS [Sclerotinia trifoliorum]
MESFERLQNTISSYQMCYWLQEVFLLLLLLGAASKDSSIKSIIKYGSGSYRIEENHRKSNPLHSFFFRVRKNGVPSIWEHKKPQKLKQTPGKVEKYLWDEMIVENFAQNLEPRQHLYNLLDGA